ncbi:unnamed protein product [Prorocentrum cordatum]|uniref:Dethiobiotin synthase n=1 Tax=Prorocentrum cordatum TaxID=2364126 RepID=A0ABN9UAI5_9DINO|nr:unnamed protein product [Polarella glacialis]
MHHFRNGRVVTPEAIQCARPGTEGPMGSTDVAGVLAAVGANGGGCVRLFVAGALTHVGKTTVCLGVLQALRRAGLRAEELAYIKPATQCEAPDLLQRWCEAEGVEHVAGEKAPMIFYQGFTRSFLVGEQGTSAQWLAKISASIDALAEGRRVVISGGLAWPGSVRWSVDVPPIIVDGVGFPAVGSIVGVDNADVAKAARAPVLLVCKCGVGAAIDSFSLTSSYFLAKGVPVLGAVFNLGDTEGSRERFYGAVPRSDELDGLRERIPVTSAEALTELAPASREAVVAAASKQGAMGGG